MEGPEYYAERIKDYYHLSTPATRDEMLMVCADRGCPVRWGRYHGGGYYFRLPEALMLLDWGASAFVVAHELYHHILADLLGDDMALALYVFHGPGRREHESEANRFAALLCP